MVKILVSACLMGEACRYSGDSVPCDLSAWEGHELVPFCPEVSAGATIPRSPSEIRGERVVNRDGEDVTALYRRGAENTLAFMKERGITRALLKEKSPSCGNTLIYDGTFSGKTIPGKGLTAELLCRNGFRVEGVY